MKARLFLDTDEKMKILCTDGSIAEATPENLSKLLRNFKVISELQGEEGRWDDESPKMFAYKPNQPTYAYVMEGNELVISNFTPFSILFEQKKNYDLDNFIGVNEYAKEVGKSVEQVKVYLRKGRIPDAKKIGRDWIISRESIKLYPCDLRISSGEHTKRK